MKIQYFVFSLLIVLVKLSVAQNLELNKYKFGEGLRFTDKNSSTYNIGVYIQPSLEIKKYVNDTPIDPYLRFRIRRLRFRMEGNLPKYKMEYRLQAEFSCNAEIGDENSRALFDAWLAYHPTPFLEIKFGQSSCPTGRSPAASTR